MHCRNSALGATAQGTRSHAGRASEFLRADLASMDVDSMIKLLALRFARLL
jgi:hypothetical protein